MTIKLCNKKIDFQDWPLAFMQDTSPAGENMANATISNAWKFKSSHPCKSRCLKNLGKYSAKVLWWGLISIKLWNEDLQLY